METRNQKLHYRLFLCRCSPFRKKKFVVEPQKSFRCRARVQKLSQAAVFFSDAPVQNRQFSVAPPIFKKGHFSPLLVQNFAAPKKELQKLCSDTLTLIAGSTRRKNILKFQKSIFSVTFLGLLRQRSGSF